MGNAEIGTWLALIAGPGGATGVLVMGRIADRLGAKDARWYMWLAMLASLLPLPFTFGFLLLDDPIAALICYIPHTVLGAGYTGPLYAVTQAPVKVRMRAFAVAIHLLVTNLIGLGAGPQVVGILSDFFSERFGAHSLRYALMIVGVTNLISAWFYFLASRTVRKDLATRED
jgi:predicted MFS family arabinose efflux permease